MTLPLVQSLTLAILLNSARSLQQTLRTFSVRWVEAGALQLGLSIPPRFVAQPRLLNRATGIPGLTTGAITELLGTEALALLVKG